MAEGAADYLAQQGVAARCRVVAGDFFAEVPAGGDLYLLSWVLLDWDDAHALRILQRCRAAMGAQGRLLVCEALLPDHAVQHNRVVGRDLSMLVMTGGQERTAAAYGVLLAQAGFAVVRLRPTRFERHVIEARPYDANEGRDVNGEGGVS